MSLSFREKKILSIIPHVTGFLSVAGSGLILYDILSDARRNLKRTYYRILFGLSFFDCTFSVWAGMSTWPIPAGTAGVYDARGTAASCTAQGFFLQLSMISPLYNSMLALYYLLLVRFDMTEEEVAIRYEPIMHSFAALPALGTAFAGLGLELYNNAVLWCWIAPYPLGCQGSDGEAGSVECERGYNAYIYRWAFFYGPVWATIAFVTVVLILLVRCVKKDEAKSIEIKRDLCKARASRRVSTMEKMEAMCIDTKYERTTRMFWQAFWYGAAFYVTWTPATINRLAQLITGNTYFALMVLQAVFFPMQGLFNYMVYSRGPCIA